MRRTTTSRGHIVHCGSSSSLGSTFCLNKLASHHLRVYYRELFEAGDFLLTEKVNSADLSSIDTIIDTDMSVGAPNNFYSHCHYEDEETTFPAQRSSSVEKGDDSAISPPFLHLRRALTITKLCSFSRPENAMTTKLSIANGRARKDSAVRLDDSLKFAFSTFGVDRYNNSETKLSNKKTNFGVHQPFSNPYPEEARLGNETTSKRFGYPICSVFNFSFDAPGPSFSHKLVVEEVNVRNTFTPTISVSCIRWAGGDCDGVDICSQWCNRNA
ncbi:hypothetical protein BLNAU_18041 [Blattamonas nauphoetae]|uniref:Uncharacterized protein n=1 Tax=Blattamonas nauphoetae TaxID=2049346 RepID=A0ABQ9X5I7_9EUKA|nr:hypothetical protein BLNAU_18041 [Blattamonas nauphoetae]